MYDAALFYAGRAEQRSRVMNSCRWSPAAFVLATCHRAESTDSREALRGIVDGLASDRRRARRDLSDASSDAQGARDLIS